MARISRLSLGLLTALSATATGACVDNQEALIVRQAVAWPSSEENGVEVGDCVADPNADLLLPRGLLDVSFGTGYLAPLVVSNNMAPRAADDSPNGIDDSEIRLLEAEVELTIPQAPEIADALTASDPTLTNFIVPLQSYSLAGGQDNGLLIPVISSAAAQSMAGAVQAGVGGATAYMQALATITIHGERAVKGGKYNEIQAREFVFPIDLCYGCLRSCRACIENGVACPENLLDPSVPFEGGVCLNAQDFAMSPSQCLQNN